MSSDWASLARAQQGDQAAWRMLVDQHHARLVALALFVTGSAAAANDVAQETFLRALNARIKNERGTVRGFLGTIAYRLALKEAKRIRRNTDLDGEDLPHHAENALESILRDERDCLVAEAIAALDEEHRNVLVLRFYAGHSYEEIAEIIEAPLGTVKSRIFYAVKSCREALRQKGVFK